MNKELMLVLEKLTRARREYQAAMATGSAADLEHATSKLCALTLSVVIEYQLVRKFDGQAVQS